MADCRLLLSWLALGLVCVHVGAGLLPCKHFPFRGYYKRPAVPQNNYPDLTGYSALFHQLTKGKGSPAYHQAQHHQRQQQFFQLKPTAISTVNAPTVVKGNFEDSVVITHGGVRAPINIQTQQFSPLAPLGGGYVVVDAANVPASASVGAAANVNFMSGNIEDSKIIIDNNAQASMQAAALDAGYYYPAAAGAGDVGSASASVGSSGTVNFLSGNIDDSKVYIANNAAASLQDGLGSLSGGQVSGQGSVNVLTGDIDDSKFRVLNDGSAFLRA